MRLHLVGLPHTELTSKFLTCAYTQKVVKFGKMMTEAGHDVFLYAAGDTSEAVCEEYVPLLSTEERLGFYGPEADDPNTTWGHVTWDPADPPWKLFIERATKEIAVRAEPRDVLLLSSGGAQYQIANAVSWLVACEPFVGYEGIYLPFCAFESHAWRHHIYGKRNINDGRWYDTVIPNFFDPDDFHVGERDGYLLYVGRLIYRKGIMTANQLAKACDRELVVAGPGAVSYESRTLTSFDGCVLEDVDYRGPVGPQERSELMADAYALVAPTSYIEPFGGVAVEAMLCGTPVIATDWGAFTETVEIGLTGFRFRTLLEGVRAVELARALPPATIRRRAIERYSLEAVACQFISWFERLDGLHDGGWPNLTYTRPGVKEVADVR